MHEAIHPDMESLAVAYSGREVKSGRARRGLSGRLWIAARLHTFYLLDCRPAGLSASQDAALDMECERALAAFAERAFDSIRREQRELTTEY